MSQSLQELHAPLSRCFGCGPANDQGLRIRSIVEGDKVVAEWMPQAHHEAFPGVLNGGIVGALLDCHSNWTAAHHLMQRSGATSVPSTVTSEFHVKLKRPTPSKAPVRLEAVVVESSGDRAVVEATLSSGGKVTSTCRGAFVSVPPGHPAFHRWNDKGWSVRAKQYSMRAATWFALAGLALGVLVLFVMGWHDVLAEFSVSIAAGGVTAIAIARWLAGVYASHLQRPALVPSALLGAVVALGTVIGGTLSGALVQVGIDWARGMSLYSTPIDVLQMPFTALVMVLAVGGLPAVLLGCAFGLLVRRRGMQLRTREGD